MVNIQTENFKLCVPGLDSDCSFPDPAEQEAGYEFKVVDGWDRQDVAVILHGLIAIANVGLPIWLRFYVVQYQLLPSLSQYASDYFGVCGILYWVVWQAFWTIHGTIFVVPAILWLLTYTGWMFAVKGFVYFLNMTYFATFILYPIEFAAFAFATSPYLTKSISDRDFARFGQHGEWWSPFVWFGLAFTTSWIQLTFNKDLNRYLEGEPRLCDPFKEDCSAVYQAQKAADARREGNEVENTTEEEPETIDQTSFSVFTF